MKRYLPLLIVALSCLYQTAMAQSERVILKDGTVYEGYVQRQTIVDNKVIFRIAFTAFDKTFETKGSNRTDREYAGDAIPEKWYEWAKVNNLLRKDKGKEVLTLALIDFPGMPTREYYVLRNGTDEIRCHCIYEYFVDVPGDSILRNEKDLRDPTLLTDMNDVVSTTQSYKPYVGIITKQVPGVSLVIWDCATGSYIEVKNKEILSTGKQPLNPDYSIWEQSPYLDRIVSKTNGVEKEAQGVIIDNVRSEDGSRTFRIETKSGVLSFPANNLVRLEKFPNKEYTPKYDIILEPGQAVINRDSSIAFSTILKQESGNNNALYYLDPKIINDNQGQSAKQSLFTKKDKKVKTEDLHINVINDKEVVIETNNPDIEKVTVLKAVERKLALVPKKDPVDVLSFTPADYFEAEFKNKVSKEVSINGTTKITFTVQEPGYYFILPSFDKAWVIQYKKPE